MDLGRFHRAIHIIDVEVKRIGVQTNLDQLIQDLNNISSSPASPEFSKAFKDHIDELRDGLITSELQNPSDSDVAQVVANLNLINFIGEGLLNQILTIFQSNQLSAALASAALTNLKTEVIKKLNLIGVVNRSFSELEVEYFSPADNDGEMLINLPVEESTKTLEELSKEAKEWHRICDAISETFDITRTSVTIRTLASGSWLLYLAGTPAFIYGVAKCMKSVNVILAELIKMKSLSSELAASKAPKEILEKLNEHNLSKVKTDLDELATNLVKEFYQGGDTARGNELRNALSNSLQRLSRKLADGAQVQLRLTMPKKPQAVEGEETTEEQKIQLKNYIEAEKIQKEIELVKPLVNFSEHQAELLKALPAPTSDFALE